MVKSAAELGTRPIAIAIGVLVVGVGAFLLGRAGSNSTAPIVIAKVDQGPIVARWDGGELTATQLRDRVLAQKSSAGLQELNASNARTFAEATVQAALLAGEARRLGFDRDPKVEAVVTEALSKRLVERELEDPSKRPPTTDADVKRYYEAHREEFLRPERLRLSDLVMAKRAPLEKIRKELSTLPPSEAEPAFAARARANSSDATTAGVGGALGSLSREQLEARVGASGADKVWQLVKLGELSELLETDGGVHLLRLAGREAPLDLTLEKARPQIESRLWYERRDGELRQFIETLKKTRGLVVDEAQLNQVLSQLR